ncbi:MAG: hypothetical protein ACK55I_19345, partial [bacterium]
MDDHFSKILTPFAGDRGSVAFIASPTFVGAKRGYVFHLGDRGLGYYLDRFSKSVISSEESDVKIISIDIDSIIFHHGSLLYCCMNFRTQCRSRTARKGKVRNLFVFSCSFLNSIIPN